MVATNRFHQENRAVVFAVARQLRAAGKAEPVRLGEDAPEHGVAHVFQQAEGSQPLAQRFRKDGIVAEAKGSEKRHVHRLGDVEAYSTKPSSRRPPSA
jgi:hypothetical protein